MRLKTIKNNLKAICISILLAGAALLTGCGTEESCDAPPCPRPNINDRVGLILFLPNSQMGDPIRLVRIVRSSQNILDTLHFELPADKEIGMGTAGPVAFSEPAGGEAIEQANLDFQVLITEVLTHRITNIEIERLLAGECSCPDYQITTLELDGQLVEVNAEQFTLSL